MHKLKISYSVIKMGGRVLFPFLQNGLSLFSDVIDDVTSITTGYISKSCIWAKIEPIYADIMCNRGVSCSAFYSSVYKDVYANNHCSLLALKLPRSLEELWHATPSLSRDGLLNACIVALDGRLCQIKALGKSVSSYFSSHCQAYGVNVQATCDAMSKFTIQRSRGRGLYLSIYWLLTVEVNKMISQMMAATSTIHSCISILRRYLVCFFQESGTSAEYYFCTLLLA